MRRKVKDVSEESAPEAGCHHYWMLERASGPVSIGVCKLCGTEREFLNSLPQIISVRGRHTKRLFDLPELPDVEPDEESKS